MAGRFVMPYSFWVNGDSVIEPGAQLNFYITGTNTRKNTYSDPSLTVPYLNPNPVVADADGRFPSIFLQSGDYKVILQTDTGIQLWTADPVNGGASPSAFGTELIEASDAAEAREILELEWAVSVTQFGADPTGASDSTTAFQDAVDSGAAIVFIPAGAYKITSINITNPIRIIGAGGDYARTGDSATRITSGSSTSNIIRINSDNVYLDGFTINGTGPRYKDSTTEAEAIVVGDTYSSATGGAITALDNTLTTGGGTSFTSGDVGKYIKIPGAGTAGAPLYTQIAAYNGPNSIETTTAAVTSVTGQTVLFGYVRVGCCFRNISVNSHAVGIHFISAANYLVEGCDLQSFRSIVQESVLSVDKGDSTIISTHFGADTVAGQCLLITSGGGLRVMNNKFLDAQDLILVQWTNGLSGGPIITGNSLENCTRRFISVTGDGTSELQGLIITGNWINGGTAGIYIADNAVVKKLQVTGNTITSSAALDLIYIGSLVDGLDITANYIDGGNFASACGVRIAIGAQNGLIGPNFFTRVSSPTSNSGTNIVSSYEAGPFTPVLTFVTPGDLAVTYSAQVGRYTKSGRLVTVAVSILTSAFTFSTATGDLTITGLPYPAASVSNNQGVGPLAFQGITKASYTQFTPVVSPTTSLIKVLASGSGQALSSVTASNMPSGGTVQLSLEVTYETAF